MYKLLKDSLKIRRYLLVTILVIQFISVILSTLLPYMNGMFVDMLIDIKNVEEVIKYAITIAGVGIISLFLSYIYNLKIMKVKNNISFEINSRGILHLQKIPLEIEYEPTYMTQRLNSDSTGENGIGKTTFLKGMLGLFNEYTGNVYYSDENLGKIDKFYLRKNNISVMLQNEKVPYMNVEEYLCKFLDKNSLKKIKDEIIQIGGGELLNKIHLEELRKKNLQQISDGERQIVLCLRTILKKADIYLLDEPTTNLSIEIANLFLDFLLEIKKKKIVLIISHDEMVINKADMKIKISKNLVEKVKIMKT